jgi:16S rRNA (guanine527-N7)-methyltransferase
MASTPLDLSGLINSLLGLQLTPKQREAFAWYARELLVWNKKVNLTAITDPDQVEIKHFLDSLSCLLVDDFRPPGRVIDIGTGAGFPGLPVKIAFPRFQLTLVESIGKKADFCRHIVEGLEMDGVEIVNGRAEQLGRDPRHREAYDWGLARAVASLPALLEYVVPFLRLGGRAILQKGEAGPAEVHESGAALQLLGAEVEALIPVELPRVPETRHLVVVRKCAGTPANYPRRVGVPSRRPLE